MTLRVDFNMRDTKGRVIALLTGDNALLQVGQTVLAEDAEGNRCKAQVKAITRNSPLVAHLSLEAGTAEPSKKSDWIASLR